MSILRRIFDRLKMSSKEFKHVLMLSGILTSMGLLVESLTLFWPHPLTFVVFLSFGAMLVFAGILTYLYCLVFDPRRSHEPPPGGIERRATF